MACYIHIFMLIFFPFHHKSSIATTCMWNDKLFSSWIAFNNIIRSSLNIDHLRALVSYLGHAKVTWYGGQHLVINIWCYINTLLEQYSGQHNYVKVNAKKEMSYFGFIVCHIAAAQISGHRKWIWKLWTQWPVFLTLKCRITLLIIKLLKKNQKVLMHHSLPFSVLVSCVSRDTSSIYKMALHVISIWKKVPANLRRR